MSRDTYALNQSLEFIRSSLSNLDVASQFECEKGQLTDITNMYGPYTEAGVL
jgi:hypothetical protein